MFGNVPRALWSRLEKPDSKDRILLSTRTLLIETKDLKILCETGVGAFFEPKLAERYGVKNQDSHELLKNLEKLGVKEEEINYVILSHLHFDHAGGLLPLYQELQAGKTDLHFPKAKYVVGKKAFERALNPHLRDRASFIPGLTDKLKKSDRLVLVEGNHLPDGVLKDKLSFIFTEGHTPGQMHILIEDEDHNKLFFAGDLIPGKSWVHLPITMGYDRWPEKLIEEKKSVYERAEKEKWLVFFTHDKNISVARVRKNKKNHYETYDERKTLNRSSKNCL